MKLSKTENHAGEFASQGTSPPNVNLGGKAGGILIPHAHGAGPMNVTTTHPGAAAFLVSLGFPIEHAHVGRRSRVVFRFPAESRAPLDLYFQSVNTVSAIMERAKNVRRTGVESE